MAKNISDDLTDQEIVARREAGLKKLLATPPKPHKPKPENAKSDKARHGKPVSGGD